MDFHLNAADGWLALPDGGVYDAQGKPYKYHWIRPFDMIHPIDLEALKVVARDGGLFSLPGVTVETVLVEGVGYCWRFENKEGGQSFDAGIGVFAYEVSRYGAAHAINLTRTELERAGVI